MITFYQYKSKINSVIMKKISISKKNMNSLSIYYFQIIILIFEDKDHFILTFNSNK